MTPVVVIEPTLGELLAPTGLPALLERTPSQLLADLGIGPGAGRRGPGVDRGTADSGASSETDGAGANAAAAPDPTRLLAPPAPPDLPVLPALDPSALLAPLAQLLGSFGTGTLPGGPSDPTAMLTGLAQVLETGAGAATSALQGLNGLWSGQSGAAAAGKSALSTANTGALATQGAAMATDIQGALAIVGAGLAAIQGVIVKTAGLLAGVLPAIATPPGQLAALGIAAEGITEALAVIGSTRAQLAAPTAKMTADGAKIPVTPPPVTPDQLSGLIQAALPLVSSGVQLAGTLLTSAIAPATEPAADRASAPGGLVPTSPMSVGSGWSGTPGRSGQLDRLGPANPSGFPVGTVTAGAPVAPALSGTPAGAPGSGVSGLAGASGTPTVRPVALGAMPSAPVGMPAAPPVEPTLAHRPLVAEPLPGGAPSPAAAAPGWAAPGTAPAGTPMAPLTPALGGAPAARTAAAIRAVPFDTGAAEPDTAPVIGSTVVPVVTVDVDFLLNTPEDRA
ncbi:MAG: hypothetical protein QM809_08185 [Gordonia sp. (in: high G+C Gram-positive bacteria)]|uniref:hypothetical protein n=1 Tax=Gordonia sp. (in: high G+C Gram-positive bacteria) TaxID=84139 RepID=UPI0039E60A0F